MCKIWDWSIKCVATFVIVYNHLYIVKKINRLFVLDSGSPFMRAAMFLLKPRKDKEQHMLLMNGLE